jgi:hypothetical protein
MNKINQYSGGIFMAQFKAFDSRVEVNGQTVLSVVDGCVLKDAALQILADNGITNISNDSWYSQQAWLDAFKLIADQVGIKTLYTIGYKIPDNAQFPPEIDDIGKGLAAIDVAYHMNHRINDEMLFNPLTGVMKEGIGHYGFEKTGEKQAKMCCENPYPCDFDRGIIEAMAKRFKPASSLFVNVTHDDSAPCRKKGDNSCTYIIKW